MTAAPSSRSMARHGPPAGWHDPLVAVMAVLAEATAARMDAELPPLNELGEELGVLGEELAEDAFGAISGLLRFLTDAIRESGGMSRAEARRAAAEGHPEILRARYRRERLTRQYRATERAAYRGERAPSARQALGHPGAEDVGPRVSFFAGDPARVLLDVEVDRRAARRVGVYMESARRLLDGRLAAVTFDRRFGRWAAVRVLGPESEAGTYSFATAAEVLALAATIGPDVELVFDSGRRRTRRPRMAPRRKGRRR